ncbi:MAG: glycosyltransferase family 2 protein [Armatimonadia bacterium]
MSADLWAAGRDPGPQHADLIIPVFNQVEYTRDCLNSIVAHTTHPYHLIIVDNGSDDGTDAALDEFSRDCPHLEVIRNPENLGFTKAINQGMVASTGRYVVLLNNDTKVTPAWLTGLIVSAEMDDRIGIVGPRTLDPATGRVHNIGGLIFYQAHTSFPLGRGASRHDLQLRQVLDVQYAEGSCMLIKRSVIESIGVLDEVFSPGYYEDSDYCFRAREAGFRIVYSPYSEIYHHATVTATALEQSGKGISRVALRNEMIFRSRWAHRFWSEARG